MVGNLKRPPQELALLLFGYYLKGGGQGEKAQRK
jgi:hypothetical protein